MAGSRSLTGIHRTECPDYYPLQRYLPPIAQELSQLLRTHLPRFWLRPSHLQRRFAVGDRIQSLPPSVAGLFHVYSQPDQPGPDAAHRDELRTMGRRHSTDLLCLLQFYLSLSHIERGPHAQAAVLHRRLRQDSRRLQRHDDDQPATLRCDTPHRFVLLLCLHHAGDHGPRPFLPLNVHPTAHALCGR